MWPMRSLRNGLAGIAVTGALTACIIPGPDGTPVNLVSEPNQNTFDGFFTVALSKTQDTCGSSAGDELKLFHEVEQEGPDVRVDEGDLTYIGTVNDDRASFRATFQVEVDAATVEGVLIYRVTDSEEVFDTTLALIVRRSDGTPTCGVDYSGTATR